MDASRHASYAPLAAILLLATILQVALLARLPTISADGIIFIGIARQLCDAPLETFRTEDQHPGYPAMLLACTSAVRWLGYRSEPESWMIGGVIVSFVCGLSSVAVVWLLARDLFDTQIANLAATVFTVLPVPRTRAVDAQSDTPHVLAYLLAAWMATTGITNGSLWRLAAAGVASGVAYWIRPEGLEVVLVAVPLLAWHAFRAHWPWRQAALAVGTLAGCAILIAAPYVIVAGKLTSKQLQFAKVKPAPTYIEQLASAAASRPGPPQHPTPRARNAPPASKPLKTARPKPAAEPRQMPQRGYSMELLLSVAGAAIAAFINSICQGFKFVFLPLYLLGLVAMVWRRPAGIQIAFLSILGATHIAVLLGVYIGSGYIAHRHVIPLVGLAMPFVALGIYQLSTWTARLLSVRPAYCRLATLGICCAIVLPYTFRRLNCEFLPVIEATRWIQSRAETSSGIVCNSPYVGFYGTLPVAWLGPESPSLDQALADAPVGPQYDYVVLHVGAHAYQDEWVAQIERSYRPILELPDPYPADRHRKVVVYQSRAGPRQAAREPR